MKSSIASPCSHLGSITQETENDNISIFSEDAGGSSFDMKYVVSPRSSPGPATEGNEDGEDFYSCLASPTRSRTPYSCSSSLDQQDQSFGDDTEGHRPLVTAHLNATPDLQHRRQPNPSALIRFGKMDSALELGPYALTGDGDPRSVDWLRRAPRDEEPFVGRTYGDLDGHRYM